MIYSLSDSKQLEGIKQPDSGVLILKDCDMYGMKLQQKLWKDKRCQISF